MGEILIILSTALATILAMWKDYSIYKKVLRVVLILLSGLALLGLVAQPKWWTGEAPHYLLLTEGFEHSEQSNSKFTAIFSLLEEHKSTPDTVWLSSPTMLVTKLDSGNSVEIRGYGVRESLPETIHWTDATLSPEKGMVLKHGIHTVEVGKEFTLKLDLIGLLPSDSVHVFKDGFPHSDFNLNNKELTITSRLYVEGPASFDVEWMSGDTLISETWNIRGIPTKLLHIGVLGFSPSFEINQLMAHLGQRGHHIYQRNRIGKDKFRYDAINAKISEAKAFFKQLSTLDVLFLDEREFESLSLSQKNQLANAVKSGLDIILNPPNGNRFEQWSKTFSSLSANQVDIEPITRLTERQWRVSNLGNQSDTELILPLLDFDFTKVPKENNAPFTYRNQDLVSVRVPNGNGSVAGHLFYQSYSWILEGKSLEYNRFWTNYLSGLINLEENRIEISPIIPRQHERIELFSVGSKDSDLTVTNLMHTSESRLPHTRNSDHPLVSQSLYWPEHKGWHSVADGNNAQWMYVYSNEDWSFDGDYKANKNTQRELMRVKRDSSDSQTRKSEVPNHIWILGFLILQMLLWVERKV